MSRALALAAALIASHSCTVGYFIGLLVHRILNQSQLARIPKVAKKN
jgi:hypothetical protein